MLLRGAQPDYNNYANITKVTFVISEMPMAKWFPNFAKILKRAKGKKIPQDAAVYRRADYSPPSPLPPPY